MDSRVLSKATIRWRVRRDVKRRLNEIHSMQTERIDLQCCRQELTEERQTDCRERVTEAIIENSGSDREEGGRLLDEDLVEMDTSHFDQQSFLIDGPNLGASLHNWSLTYGVSLVALTALLGLLRLYHPDLPKDARTLLKTKTTTTCRKDVEDCIITLASCHLSNRNCTRHVSQSLMAVP